MDASWKWFRSSLRARMPAIAGLLLALVPCWLQAADFRTQNFLIMAPSPELAQAVGVAAEGYRRDLAIHWLGRELPPWPTPCPVRVVAGDHLAAQGVTTYNRSPVRDFQMEVVGSPERILDSVLPHEVTHTILATHFGRPLPRWADEGICTTVEHPIERQKHEAKLREFLSTRRGISMNKLFLMTEYPADVLPMYAQGYSVCQFLIAQRGSRQFVDFVGDYMRNPSWTQNVRKHYDYESLAELQQMWLAWVAQGSGPVDAFVKNPGRRPTGDPAILLAAAQSPPPAPVAGTPPAVTAAAVPAGNSARTAGGQPEGWYSRLKEGTVSPGQPGTPLAAGAIALNPPAPPAVRGAAMPPRPAANQLYSSAQPQPEQGSVGVGGGGVSIPWPAPTMPSLTAPSPVSAPAPVSAAGREASTSINSTYRDGYRPGSIATPGHYLR